jgi:hypothetical protein
MYTLADETFMDYALSAVHSHRRARGKIVNNNSPYLHLFKTDDELGYPELIGRLIFEWKDEFKKVWNIQRKNLKLLCK